MGILRVIARHYRRATGRTIEHYLKEFCFIRVGDVVEAHYNTVTTGLARWTLLHPHMDPNKVLFSSNIPPGDAPDATYYNLFMKIVHAYQLEKTRSGGYNISDFATRNALTDLSLEELIGWSSSIRGNNIIPVTIKPTIEWKPSVSLARPMARLAREAYYYSILHDNVYANMYSHHHAEFKESIANIRERYIVGRECLVVPKLKSLKYLCQEKLLQMHPENDPVYIEEESFVSGGSYRGFLEAAGKMAREHVTPTETPKVILTAYMRMMAKQHLEIKTDPYPLDAEHRNSVKFASTRSAGINLHHEATRDICHDIIIDYVWQSNKDEAELGTRQLLDEIVGKILYELKKGNTDYNPEWFSPAVVLHKMSMKVESRTPGTDPYKTRIIFVVNAIKTLLDKTVLTGAMKRNYNVGANAIGTKWLHGGAEEFAASMGVPTPPPASPEDDRKPYVPLPKKHGRAWLCLDIAKFDQSVLATLLLLVLFLPILAYNRLNKWWPATSAILRWCLDRSVTKIVKWFGPGWRAIHGLMFSGEFLTSQGDSYYLELLFECFDIWLRDRMLSEGRVDMARRFETCFRSFRDYGDDGVLCYDEEFMHYICQGREEPYLLKLYLREKFFMELKPEDTYICWDDCEWIWGDEADVGFVTHIDEDGFGGFEILKRGVKFLKRYFIRDSDGQLLPWRPTNDYFSKSVCVVNSPDNMARHVIRLRALMCDTYGTNIRAYNHLKRMDDYLVRSLGVSLEAEVSKLALESSVSDGDTQSSLSDERLFHKVGGAETILAFRDAPPSLMEIYKRTRRDEGVLRDRRAFARTKRYLNSVQLSNARKLE